MNFHGGDIYSYGDREILDFSSNINPLGIPDSFKKGLLENLNTFTQYPDINYLGLRKALAQYIGIDNFENIVVGNGAVEIIYKTVAALAVEKVIIATPTFSEYKRAAEITEIPHEEVPTYLENGSSQLDLLTNKIIGNSLIVLCNPNNPTGTLTDLDQISQLAQRLLGKKGYLLVDEAFIEFTPNYTKSSMVNKLNQFPNVIVVRALTKFFGMPGIRLGYGVCQNSHIVKAIKDKLEPWNINTAGVIAGLTVLKDTDYIERSREWIDKERDYLNTMLTKMEGITVIPTSSNFMLIKVQGLTPWEIKKLLLRKDILIRTPEGFTGIFPGYFRIAIKNRAANDKLLTALEEIILKLIY